MLWTRLTPVYDVIDYCRREKIRIFKSLLFFVTNGHLLREAGVHEKWFVNTNFGYTCTGHAKVDHAHPDETIPGEGGQGDAHKFVA